MKLALSSFLALAFLSPAWALPVIVINQCDASDFGCPNNKVCLHPTISGKCIKSKTITLIKGAGPTAIADVGYKCNYKIAGPVILHSAKINLTNKGGLSNVTVTFGNDLSGLTCKPTVVYNP